MTEEQRADLEKLARAATPGERWAATSSEHDLSVLAEVGAKLVLVEAKDHDWDSSEQEWRDANFIAAANPATVLDLLATIARLEAEKVKDGEALEQIALEAGQRDADFSEIEYMARARLSSRAKDQSQ